MNKQIRIFFAFALVLVGGIARAGSVRDSLAITPWVSYPLTIGGSTTAPTKSANKSNDAAFWRRVGDTMEITYLYRHVDATSVTVGDGIYLFSLPEHYSIDTSKLSVSTDIHLHAVVGSASGYQSGIWLTGHMWPYSTTQLAMVLGHDGFSPVSSTDWNLLPDYPSEEVHYSFEASVPISGWDTRD